MKLTAKNTGYRHPDLGSNLPPTMPTTTPNLCPALSQKPTSWYDQL